VFRRGKVRVAVVLVVSSFLSVASTGAEEVGDPRIGEVLFRSHCGTCHAIDRPRTIFGPHLVGVYGREAGMARSYRYTFEMSTSGIVWDEETLDALMVNPQTLVPGTNMYFSGMRDAESRAHIIAFLRQQAEAE
jgi:cytochrome c